MARTLKTSGIATSLKFLLAVEDDNATIKVFKSFDGSDVENTSAVNAAMTVHANTVVHAPVTWGSATVPYFYDSTNNSDKWVSFGTDKPYIPHTFSTTQVATYVICCRTPSTSFSQTAPFGGDTSTDMFVLAASGGNNTLGLYRVIAGNYMVLEGPSPAPGPWVASTQQTWAAVHDSTSGHTNRFYRAASGSALSQTATLSSDGNGQYGNMTWVGADGAAGIYNFDGANGSWVSLIAVFDGEIPLGSAGTGGLHDLHADPYGTLFDSAAGQPTMRRFGSMSRGFDRGRPGVRIS